MNRMVKEMVILAVAGFALLYLLFPSVLPDFVPLVGWIDEGIATGILLSTLRYYGIDFTALYGGKNTEPTLQQPQQTIQVQSLPPEAQRALQQQHQTALPSDYVVEEQVNPDGSKQFVVRQR